MRGRSTTDTEAFVNTLILYDSLGGNTRKVAQAIHEVVLERWGRADLAKASEAKDLDLFGYGLIFVGSPVIDWLPTKRLMDWVHAFLKGVNTAGGILPSSPVTPGRFGLSFCTYGGPHIGVREAVPATAWLDSFLGHLGYLPLEPWHVPGALAHREDLNLAGRLGDIRNRPDDRDLDDVRNRTSGVLASLEAFRV
jgi:hypothetical protein